MKFFALFIFYLVYFQISANAFPDYFWRDYDGTVPCDAIQGGTDQYGYYTYIGQVAALDKCSPDLPDLVSATIYQNDLNGYAAYHSKVFKNNKNVKILCSNNMNKYLWSRTYNENCDLVRGSFTANYTNYYIGRTNYKGQNVTGRFSLDLQKLFVPWVPTPNILAEFTSYEMLMYCKDL